MYTCMHVHIHVPMYTCTHVHIHVHTYTRTQVHKYTALPPWALLSVNHSITQELNKLAWHKQICYIFITLSPKWTSNVDQNQQLHLPLNLQILLNLSIRGYGEPYLMTMIWALDLQGLRHLRYDWSGWNTTMDHLAKDTGRCMFLHTRGMDTGWSQRRSFRSLGTLKK